MLQKVKQEKTLFKVFHNEGSGKTSSFIHFWCSFQAH